MGTDAPAEGDAEGPLFFPVDIGRYRHHAPLDTDTEVAGVAALLAPFGARPEPWTADPEERGADAVDDRLEHWSVRAPAGDTVLYWVGHGSADGASTALLAHSRSPNPLTRNGVTPQDLLHHVRTRQLSEGAGWAVVVIDTCDSRRFIELMSAQATTDADVGGFLLVATSQDGAATLGAFRRTLGNVLGVTFRAQDTVNLDDLARELNRALFDRVAIAHTDGTAELRRVWPTQAGHMQAPLDVEAEIESALAAMSADERRHFAAKAAGGELGEQNWYFEGREHERDEILSWLDGAAGGMLVVTGAAGAGKSALLGHVLVHTRPELAAVLTRAGHLAPLPPGVPRAADTVDLAVHLTGATAHALVDRITAAADLGPAPAVATVPELAQWLTGAFAARRSGRTAEPGRPFTVLADALDEAHQPLTLAAEVLGPLSRTPGVRVLVGTRRSTQEGPDRPAPTGQDLLDALGPGPAQGIGGGTKVVTVGPDPEAMTRYIRRRLDVAHENGSLTADPADLDGTARVLGGLDREFLFARLAVHEILGAPELAADPAPLQDCDHRALFARAVARLTARDPVNGLLLEALALARGHGMPDRDGVWATAANALAPDTGGPAVLAGSVTALTVAAAPYLMADLEHGQTVYRLAHRTFAEHFAAPDDGPDERHQHITRHLAGGADTRLPDTPPNPYLVHHLPEHAALAGPDGWESLAAHPRVLDRLDVPALTLHAVLSAFGRHPLPPAVAGVVAHQHLLADAAPGDRTGLRQLGTVRISGDRLPPVEDAPDPRRTWSVRWADIAWEPLHVVLNEASGRVSHMISLTARDGSPLLATYGENTVRIWDPVTLRPTGPPLTGHNAGVSAMAAFTGEDGRPLLATAGRDGTVRVWDPATHAQVGPPLTGHEGSVNALTTFTGQDGRPRIATAGGDKTVRVWNPATASQVGASLTGHVHAVDAITTFTGSDGRARLASLDAYAIRIWDPVTRRQSSRPYVETDFGLRRLVAFTGPEGRDLLATVRRQARPPEIFFLDPDTGSRHEIDWIVPGPRPRTPADTFIPEPEGQAVIGIPGPDGHTLLAVQAEGRVGLWDPVNRCESAPLVTGTMGPLDALAAFPGPDGRTLLATADRGRVRVWDRVTTGPGRAAADSQDPEVKVLASIPSSDGRVLLAASDGRDSVRIWDTGTSTPTGPALTGHFLGVTALTGFRGSAGEPLLASACHTGEVLLRDPVTRAQLGPAIRGGRHFGDALNSVGSMAAFTGADGRSQFLALCLGKAVRLVNLTTRKRIRQAIRHTDAVYAVAAFADPTGRPLLATGGKDGAVRIWDPATRTQVGPPLTGHAGSVNAMTVFTGKDGPLLASCGNDGTTRIWDPRARAPVGPPFTGYGGTTVVALPGPDGRHLLASAGSGTVLIWDPLSREVRHTIGVPINSIQLAVAGPDLAVAGWEGLVVIRVEGDGQP
ncbi:AAA family ATPase [Streptomyces sp. NPDC004126]|uniref:NACHT and WD repeat domain-containing protein n=1 Tax=Streptomyces sp. NPDC004126 TaxID=3390695 RepID=UPI003D03A9ED